MRNPRRTCARPLSATTTPMTKTAAMGMTRISGRAMSSRKGKANSRARSPARRNRQFGGRSLLPTTAEGLIEVHQRRQHIPLGLRELLFGGQALTLGVEDFEVAADAAHIAHVGEPALISERLREECLTGAVFAALLITDEGIRDVLKGPVNRLP